MGKLNDFKKLVDSKKAESTISVLEYNELRVEFISTQGLCEDTLRDILELSKQGDLLSSSIADGLTKKYLYEPPAINDGMARIIKEEICSLAEKYSTITLNNMIADTLYVKVGNNKYAVGLGSIAENLRRLNNL